MSNFLAIATVTETLRQILDATVKADVAGTEATAVRPGSPANGLPERGVNVFLYQVTPNASLRNLDLPSRDSGGAMVQRPRMALDLHYLLSFYGADAQLEPQRVLGSVVSLLHSQPLLTHEKIRQVIDDAVAGDPMHYLARSNLDAEVERVKFTPLSLSLDELSRLWSVFFQTQYALSVAYQGAAVFVEREETPSSALLVRARNVYALPFRQPIIQAVAASSGDDDPILAGSSIRVTGSRLASNATRLRFTKLDTLTIPTTVRQSEITAALPAGLRAGIQGIQVEQLLLIGTPPTEHRGFESNVFPFMLHPQITAVTAGAMTSEVVGGVTLHSGALTVDFNPPMGKNQRVVLLLNEFQPAPTTTPANAYSFGPVDWSSLGLPPATTEVSSLDIDVRQVVAGNYLVRLQVDGAESLLDADAATGRYNAPQVAI